MHYASKVFGLNRVVLRNRNPQALEDAMDAADRAGEAPKRWAA
jgi:hypothetical protein